MGGEHVTNDCEAVQIGLGLIDGTTTPDLEGWSAITLPPMLLCPGTQTRVTELAEFR